MNSCPHLLQRAMPLGLFYALSQATRAIVAAHGEQHEIGSHGLAEDRTATASDVLSRGVRRAARDDDALSALCAALNLPDPFGSTRAKIELGAASARDGRGTFEATA